MENQETIFERLVRERNITDEEMKAIIANRIKTGLNDPDPEKQEQWRRIPCAGEIPTPEERLRYAVERLLEDLCKKQQLMPGLFHRPLLGKSDHRSHGY